MLEILAEKKKGNDNIKICENENIVAKLSTTLCVCVFVFGGEHLTDHYVHSVNSVSFS